MTIGGVLALGSMLYLTQLDVGSSYATAILPAFIAMSLGLGLLFVPVSATALSGVANHDAGVASAMVNTTQQVGGSIGTALLNTIFTTTLATYIASHGPSPASQVNGAIHGYNVAFTVSAALFGVAAILSLLFIRRPADMVAEDGTPIENREQMAVGV